VFDINLEIHAGLPYISYRSTISFVYKVSVQRYNGLSWEFLGADGFSGTSSKAQAGLAIHNGSLYVAYSDSDNFNRVTVSKFNGTDWNSVIGTSGFTAGIDGRFSFAASANGLFLSYNNGGAFAKGYDLSVLPVSLLSFNLQNSGNQIVKVRWQTSSEVNNQGFEIQKSADGVNYKLLGQISSHGNNSRYVFDDVNPSLGLNYYKLFQVDNDGTRSELGLRTINIVNQTSSLLVYPNPIIRDLVRLNIPGVNGKRLAKLYNLRGQLLLSTEILFADGLGEFNLAEGFEKGSYVLSVDSQRKLVIVQ
jgi:hypothetical protein